MAFKVDKKLLVAAIDLGTTYSGYAFSFHHDFVKDPTKVSASLWSGGSRMSLKTSTCVLIAPDGTFDSFGYDAENKYATMAEDDKHWDYFYFRRFKMMLFDKTELKRDTVLEDDKGKTLPAKTVFAMCIKYLKDTLLTNSKKQTSNDIEEDDIRWVLTVPAIWNDAAKQFMREAAVEAGIPNDHLLIALEPEAASLFCRHLPVEKDAESISLASLKPGSRYMVLDCGGGTVDITVHQVMEGGGLKELHRASGGAWGGTMVDDAFMGIFVDTLGKRVVEEFRQKHADDYIDLFRQVETKKRETKPDMQGKVVFRVPTTLLNTFKKSGGNFESNIEESRYAGKITWCRDKMRVDTSIVKDLFTVTTNRVISHINILLRHEAVRGLSVILMVGGFSESQMLQHAIRKHFPQMKVIVPNEAGLAILKGAVIFGHEPTTIAERVCKYTYGVGTTKPFVAGKHCETKKVIVNGKEKCIDCFSKHVEVGRTLKLGQALREQKYIALRKDQEEVNITLYASSEKNPEYITDPGCRKVGNLKVKLRPATAEHQDRMVHVKTIFGGTEIAIEARESDTGEITKATFDFLE